MSTQSLNPRSSPNPHPFPIPNCTFGIYLFLINACPNYSFVHFKLSAVSIFFILTMLDRDQSPISLASSGSFAAYITKSINLFD